MTRFQDDKTYLYPLTERVLIECPRCGSQAEVHRAGPRCTCRSCGLSEDGLGESWVGMAKAYVKRKCGRCGRRLTKTVRRAGPHPRTMDLVCPGCGAATLVELYWCPDPAGEAYDPHFGYPLWLQAPCSGHTLWAYNAEHLAFLKQYVEATVRERAPNANATLASRLPKWMKAAKRRPAVLRAVASLEARLRSIGGGDPRRQWPDKP